MCELFFYSVVYIQNNSNYGRDQKQANKYIYGKNQ